MSTFNIHQPLNQPSTSAASDVFGFIFWTLLGPPTALPITIDQPHFPVGSLVGISASFYSLSLVLTDPTLTAVQYQDPNGAFYLLQYGLGAQVTKDGTGLYRAYIDTTGLPGIYTWRWESRGAVTESTPDNIFFADSSTLS